MGKAKLIDWVDIGFNVANLGWIIAANTENRKSLGQQNKYAIAMVGIAVVVSVGNTLWIIKNVNKNSEGAKIYELSRANGQSGNSRDGSGSQRINL